MPTRCIASLNLQPGLLSVYDPTPNQPPLLACRPGDCRLGMLARVGGDELKEDYEYPKTEAACRPRP